ncbi:DUF1680-domain-containing protein [Jaminaea rosea]|uniref:DUF1680-domain-containing protein n=1 Tax=Jaminaea rosea TaxID=1569628 RepID=A0A316UI98_9BASI|nr:DUF1680-domain-containing protein [Jaminaea rosea]PWN24634.1 DUF1680-domain-containing protein [Jaminaea rosea]
MLQKHANEEIRGHIDYLVNLIEKAQQPDGYLNIHFVVNEPDKRWSNLRDLHELYNGGHLIEASLAHHQFTASRQFLDIALRFVHYCASVFGPEQDGKMPGYPGHPEIELALLRLYRRTQDRTALELATFFITERGKNGAEYYVKEQAKRGEHPQLAPGAMPHYGAYWYMQAHMPIKDQQTIEGHAVRAGYLLTGVADLVLAEESGLCAEHRKAPNSAVFRLWDDMVMRKMYITGGIGSVDQWEGFSSLPYSLPNSNDEGGCYAETCAGISVIMVAERLLALKLDSHLAEVAERALYNASVTSGISVDGRSFMYVNQLASSPQQACSRFDWFDCACCPPNVLRTLGVLGGFFWSVSGDHTALAIHQYFDGAIELPNGAAKLVIKTQYPWHGRIEVFVDPGTSMKVLLRVPGWAVNSAWYAFEPARHRLVNGYIVLSPGNNVLTLEMQPRLARCHPDTMQDTVTLLRGPLVYCLEDADNPWAKNHFKELCISADTDMASVKEVWEDGVLKLPLPKAGYHLRTPRGEAATHLYAGANEVANTPHSKAYEEAEGQGRDLVFIPFFYRANRKKQDVQVRTSFRRKA